MDRDGMPNGNPNMKNITPKRVFGMVWNSAPKWTPHQGLSSRKVNKCYNLQDPPYDLQLLTTLKRSTICKRS